MANKHFYMDGLIKTRVDLLSSTSFQITRSQDIAPILDFNKELQNDSTFNNGYTPSRDMQHVASIPVVVYEQWWKDLCKHMGRKCNIYGPEMKEYVKRQLNDPDNKFLRTGQGTVK
jgi:hypothetical protein